MEQQEAKDRSKRIQRSLNRPYFFIFPIIAGLLIAGLILSMYQSRYDILHSNERLLILSSLSDCFFVAGVIVCGVGVLVLIAGEGFFDMLVYGVSRMMSYIFIPKERHNHESFLDYKLRKEAEREGGHIWFIAADGLVFLLIAFFMAIPFFNVSPKKINAGFEASKDKIIEVLEINQEDFHFEVCEYIYVKFIRGTEDTAHLQKYGGTVFYRITFYNGDSTLKSVRFVCYYIDDNRVEMTDANTYNDLYKNYDKGLLNGTRSTIDK